MSSGMPELGSKISLISKADIRYEGRLFTVDPQECTIALASVRSFGTEDRETQYPVAPQNQVYDYILFRGSDIKDIRVLNNVPSLPNDPAIVQMSVPPSLGGGQGQGQYSGQYNHPVVGQTQYPQYHPMGGFPGSVHPQLNKTSSMLDLIGGGSQQGVSRSGTPAVIGHRKSPTTDQGTQAGASGQERRNSSGSKQAGQTRPRPSSRTRQRQPSGSHNPPAEHMDMVQNNYNRGGWRGRSRGRGRGFVPRNKNTLKFEKDYDFEQANTQFEELRIQLAKTKIADGDVKTEGEVDKKDDSGNETGAGEAELEEHDVIAGYDKKKSFFDNISCEAVERSKGRSQRTDWRTERKLNSETFGVSSARRGAWRPRASWRHGPHPPHGHMHHPHPHPHSHPPAHPMSYFPSWRPMRGGRGRPNNNPNARRNTAPPPQTQPQPQSAAAK
ncbi:protein LSM14 homolog car-1 isoform X5 [Danaus plexippus]|uniref:protein LSM14 homolog car-1 isoform X5 n=1 Tax=Danaus plexippus TaxID=13037 RepID=UPI002AB0F51D|nr:protein LSM14 homolog car-1 isoform X5 [Danaus plexippus]